MQIIKGKLLYKENDKYKLTSAWTFQTKTKKWIVSADYETDLASIPVFFNLVWRKNAANTYDQAAILHDFLFTEPDHAGVSYFEAQLLYLDAMLTLNTSLFSAIPIFIAVTLFSWIYFYDDNLTRVLSKVTEKTPFLATHKTNSVG
jgi:hypothetical protein